jgi:hypothetical protein
MSPLSVETPSSCRSSRLAVLLEKVPPGLRGPLVMSAASLRPNATLEASFAVGEFRAALAEYWEAKFGTPLPIRAGRSALDPPISIRTVMEFNQFALTRDSSDIQGDCTLPYALQRTCSR